jgi:hypothetical protein
MMPGGAFDVPCSTTAPGGDSEWESVVITGSGGTTLAGAAAGTSSGSASTHSSAEIGTGGLGAVERTGGGSERVLSLARGVGRGGGACGAAAAGVGRDAGTGRSGGFGAVVGGTFAGPVTATGAGFGVTGAGFGVTASPVPGLAASAGTTPGIVIGALQVRHGTVPPRLRTIRTMSSPKTNVAEHALQRTCMSLAPVYTERWLAALGLFARQTPG